MRKSACIYAVTFTDLDMIRFTESLSKNEDAMCRSGRTAVQTLPRDRAGMRDGEADKRYQQLGRCGRRVSGLDGWTSMY
jgi:hypothetical protein